MRRVIGLFASSIRAKVVLSFSLVIFFVLLSLVIGFFELNGVNQSSAEIVPNSERMNSLQNFALASSSMEANLERFLISGVSQLKESTFNDLAIMKQSMQSIKVDADSGVLNTATEIDAVLQSLETEATYLMETPDLSAGEINQKTLDVYALLNTTKDLQQQLTQQTLADLEDTSQQQTSAVDRLITLYMVLGILAFGVAVITSIYVSRGIATPLSVMATTVSQIAGGDLEVRVPVKSRDEIGLLSQAVNSMTEQLQGLIGSLEDRVEARTRDLNIAHQISEQVTTILDLDQLLPQIVELTKDSFQLYHTQTYLLDETGKNLRLVASSGEIGRVLVTRSHSIPANMERSLVAQAVRTQQPVIIEDVNDEDSFLPNPLLPDTQSEAVFPLIVGDRVLGALDVQDSETGRFDAGMLAVFSTLAGQIAVSIDNARLFTEIERTSRHEQTLSTITTQLQGATNMEEVMQIAARELGRALRVPHTTIALQLAEDGRKTISIPSPVPDDEDTSLAPNLETV